jgi:hypothetical protein
MNSVRYEAAAAQLREGKLLITGGYNGKYLNSAEMFSKEKSSVPSLPVSIEEHCMVTVNLTTVMVIGGFQNGQDSAKTFYLTLGEDRWTEGPELKNQRRDHSCGLIRKNKENKDMSIIVVGGQNKSPYMSSVEILDEGSQEWRTGPELPFGIDNSQLVEDQNGGVVLIGGASFAIGNLNSLYLLSHGGQDSEWTKINKMVKIGRREHTAFLIPDNIVDCS